MLGALFALVLVLVAAFALGVFEEAADGPVEDAGEAVDDALSD